MPRKQARYGQPAVYNSTAPTLSDGDDSALNVDSSGNAKINLAVQLEAVNDSITTYPYGHSSTYISTATTTTVKTGAGVLHMIVLTETAAGTITIYDNTAASGTTIGVLKASIVEGTYMFNCAFTTGLTIVTAGASKLTVVYR